MKTLKTYLIVYVIVLFCLTLSSSLALGANLVIDDDNQPAVSGLYLTYNYKDDATCIQAALDNSKSGDTITIREGDYYITKKIFQKDKSLNIIGAGEVKLHLQTPTGYKNGLYFTGSMITNRTITSNAKKDSYKVDLCNASQVRQNDLIKIWKKTQWCPLDYSDQMTGEMYKVQSVNGNVLTLTEPLLRDYNVSETVRVEVYRPIEINIRNIKVQDSGATSIHEGLTLKYCKDSSVTDSWFKSSGFSSISLYSCFNVDVINNEIYDSILPGSGYGVAVCSGTAHVTIDNNYIKNCRHAITGNTDERKSLSRNIKISNNTIFGASIDDSNAVDAHNVVIDYNVTKNKIYLESNFSAFADGTMKSVFSGNKVYGGGAVIRRGNINGGVHVIKDNYVEETCNEYGFTYKALGKGVGDTLLIENNTQVGGYYGTLFNNPESFENIIITRNQFRNILYQGVYAKLSTNGINLKISNNNFEEIGRGGIYIDGNTFKNGEINIRQNTIKNVYPSGSGSAITIYNIQKASICENRISDSTNKTQYGIFEGKGCDYNNISGNIITGMRIGKVYKTGAHTVLI